MTELASYEFGKVEGALSTLGERELESVQPQGITHQKFKSQLEAGELVLLSDAPVTPALTSTTNAMGNKVWQVNPAAASRLAPEAKSALSSRIKARGMTSRKGSTSPAIAETPYTPEPKVEEKAEKPPQGYEYLFEIACSEAVLASEVGCQFALGKTAQEAGIVTWEAKPSEAGTIFAAKATDGAPRKLIAKIASAEKGVSNQPPVKLKPKGTDAVREAFIPVIPTLQLGNRLGFPTEGYFYHFHQKKLVQEYKILGDGRWAFQATRSTSTRLNTNQGLNKYQGAILLYWKINSKVVTDQHLVYLDAPITQEQLGNVSDDWLNENGVAIDVPALLNTKKAATAAKKPNQPQTYNAPADVVYNHKERLLMGSTLKAINNTRLVESGLPVVNVKKWGETKLAFDLGYCQVEKTQPLEQFWGNLFSDETPTDIQELIKKYNAHLNNPVRQGEIVVLPTAEPETEQEKSRLDALIEEAQAASKELGKLTDDAVATVNRHFELLDYYASETLKSVKEDGLPSDAYAHASLGVGAVASGVGKHLQSINGILLEVNDLYVSQVAIASRTGGINYGPFIAERAALLRKLDGSFSALSKRSVKVPAYVQVKKNLRLSTKSVIHNADEIIAKGIVPNLGKRMANISKGVSASRGLGYIGLALGVASGANNIYDACSVNSQGECGKVATREVFGFAGGWGGGALGSSVATGGVLLILGVAGVTAAPVVAIAAVSAFVVGGATGGIAGTAAGKTVGDVVYEAVVDAEDWAGDVIEDIF